MSYANIMVSVDLTYRAEPRAKLAAHLADRFGARLTGVAAYEPFYDAAPVGPVGAVCIVPDFQQAALSELERAQALFREAAGARSDVEWRADLDFPVPYLAEQARAADLVVVGRKTAGEAPDRRCAVDPGVLVMVAGRPVLVAPPGIDYIEASRVVVAWKDTREARRAVHDALPFLKRAKYVHVVSVNEPGAVFGTRDVADHLRQHGIEATTAETQAVNESTAEGLLDVASECGADLLVMGAYGHSRMREWVFGGVTRDLLEGAPICCLMSH